MSRDHKTLERDLLAARSAYDALPVSADAWQENQRRVSGRGRAGAGPARQRWLGAAAAVLAVGMVGGAAVLGGLDGPGGGAPPAGESRASDEETGSFASEYLLGPVAVLEELQIDGELTTHRAALSDQTGDGPQLCDEYASGGFAAGGCAPRDEMADDPAVALDWLSGTSGTGSIRGVVAGVDDRVTAVEVWLSNGNREIVELHQSGWEGTQLLALTRPAGEGVPQRIVAYGRDRNVLQAVDLRAKLGGTDWLAPSYACAGDRTGELVPNGDVFPHAYVALGTSDARITHRASRDDTGSEACIEHLDDRGLAGWHAGERLLVVVAAPEVTLVRLELPEGTRDVEPQLAAGAPWGIAQIELPEGMSDEAVLVAFDRSDQALDHRLVRVMQP